MVRINKWTNGIHFFCNGRGFSLYESPYTENFNVFGCVTDGTKIKRQYVVKNLTKYETAWRYAYRRAIGAVR